MEERQHINSAVGARIRLARKQAELSQHMLANKLNRSVEMVAILESGGQAADAGLLYELSVIFSLPVTWFFADTPERPRANNDDLELDQAFIDCADMLAELRGDELLLGLREVMRSALSSRV